MMQENWKEYETNNPGASKESFEAGWKAAQMIFSAQHNFRTAQHERDLEEMWEDQRREAAKNCPLFG